MSRPVFFVHVMKTGGSALGAALRRGRARGTVFPSGEDRVLEKLYVDGLIDRPSDELAGYDVFSVHMPAWVADRVAPAHARVTLLREPVARMVSHLRHIARGLDLSSLDEVYEHPEFGPRLRDYQVRVLSEQPHEHFARRDAVAALGADTAHFEAQLRLALFTAIGSVHAMTASDLGLAVATLDRFDVVGVTEAFDGFAEALLRVCGVEVDPTQRRNVGDDRLVPSEELLARIRRDNQLDLELYAHARARAVSG